MGELYNPYPKLPKNIRQIGDRESAVKLYVEDYVNTYLKRLYPSGGLDLRVGLLLGEMYMEEGTPFLFVDGAMEMENVTADGEKVNFTESAWKDAWRMVEQNFPKRAVLGWFLCGAQGSMLSPLNYWREHGQYFSSKYQLMYLNSSLEGDEAVYVTSEDGFYRLRGYSIYYERNQMMQDYMISRKDARRVESGVRDDVIRDFRQKMEDKRDAARRRTTLSGVLGTACGILTVTVLAGGVAMFDNYHKIKEMEAVIASVMPAGVTNRRESDEVRIEEIAGEVYPTRDLTNGSGSSASAGQETESEVWIAGGNMTAGAQEDTGGTGNETEPEAEPPTGAEKGREETTSEAAPVQAPADAVTHIVQEGETLYGICLSRYHSLAALPEICRINQLEDENRISIGQKLLLPPTEQ